jgi:uncharacterized damage-inducible protein DinB
MDTDALVLQVRYSAWASRRVLPSAGALNADELLRGVGSSYGGVHGTLVHIFQADSIWFDRCMAFLLEPCQHAPEADFAAFSTVLAGCADRWVSG